MSKTFIQQILRENLQQADKFYFKNGKLSEKARQIVLMITNGDPFTKLVTDMYYTELMQGHKQGQWALKTIDDKHVETDSPESDVLDNNSLKDLQALHQDLVSYNQNVFPIKGFNINGMENIHYLMSALKQRRLILKIFNELPSIALRNMKADIRQERTYPELQTYRSDMEYFMAFYSQLSNRDEAAKSKIEAKMFKNGITLDQLLSFAEEKENLVGGTKLSRNKVKEIVKEDGHDLEIVYDKGNIMIVEVSGPHGIKKIGCNSLWCFTYGSGFNAAWQDWNNYSTNSLVYVIINFSESSDSKDFMHVLIKPLQDAYDDNEMENPTTLFDMSNEAQDKTNDIISQLLDFETAKKIMNFGEEVSKPIPKKEPYKDPNQMSLFEVKKMVRKKLFIENYFSSLIDEDYPTTWNIEEFKKLNSFNSRIKYCEAHLQRISSGSSRIVYKIDDEKVLKLAKNKKGLAQNEVEIRYSDDYLLKDVLAKIYAYDENNLWVEMELARKVTPTIFKTITGFSFPEFDIALDNFEVENKRKGYKRNINPDIVSKMWDDEFVSTIFDLIGSYDIPSGDLRRINSYGLVNGDGDERIVLIDYGLTNEVYQSYYS